MFILVVSLTSIAFADDLSPASGTRNEALEIMQDHMRSQLDWRSYFTSRMDARRRARSSGEKPSGTSRAATGEEPYRGESCAECRPGYSLSWR